MFAKIMEAHGSRRLACHLLQLYHLDHKNSFSSSPSTNANVWTQSAFPNPSEDFFLPDLIRLVAYESCFPTTQPKILSFDLRPSFALRELQEEWDIYQKRFMAKTKEKEKKKVHFQLLFCF